MCGQTAVRRLELCGHESVNFDLSSSADNGLYAIGACKQYSVQDVLSLEEKMISGEKKYLQGSISLLLLSLFFGVAVLGEFWQFATYRTSVGGCCR